MTDEYFGHTVIKHPDGWYYLVQFLDEKRDGTNGKMLLAWRADGHLMSLEDNQITQEIRVEMNPPIVVDALRRLLWRLRDELIFREQAGRTGGFYKIKCDISRYDEDKILSQTAEVEALLVDAGYHTNT